MGLRGGYQDDENAFLGTIYFTIKVKAPEKPIRNNFWKLRNFSGDALSSDSNISKNKNKKKVTVANAIIQILDVYDVKLTHKELPSINLRAKVEGQKYETKTKRKCLNRESSSMGRQKVGGL